MSSGDTVAASTPAGGTVTASTTGSSSACVLSVCARVVCAVISAISLPVAAFHSRNVPSWLPVMTRRSSLLNATVVMSLACPESLWMGCRVATSQMIAVVSALPDIKRVPSEENANASTTSMWPLKQGLQLARWRSRGGESRSPAARSEP